MALLQFNEFNKLAKKAQSGDSRAAEALYDRLVPKVFGFCMNRVGDRHLAEDLAQEIFLKLASGISKFESNKGNFLVWFWQLAKNTITDHYRKKKETQFSDLSDGNMEKMMSPETFSNLDFKLEADRLHKLVGSFGPDDLDLFEMRFVADLPYKDIAKILNKKEATVRVSINRLKTKIKETGL
jgi:RNA polymerase sigma-70 factor (ECF subfamily)